MLPPKADEKSTGTRAMHGSMGWAAAAGVMLVAIRSFQVSRALLLVMNQSKKGSIRSLCTCVCRFPASGKDRSGGWRLMCMACVAN